MPKSIIYISGKRLHPQSMLTYQHDVTSLSTTKRKRRYARFLCDCGQATVTLVAGVKNLTIKSCGCLLPERHGMSGTDLYQVWSAMKHRCLNSNDKSYDVYGGRGISVCDSWVNSFQDFYDFCIKSGYEKGLELDRIDNDLGYCPDNCRFVSKSKNNQNKKASKFYYIDGVKYESSKQASIALGVSQKTIGRWCNGRFDAGIRYPARDNCYVEDKY